MSREFVWAEPGLFAERFAYEDGVLHHELVQPSRQLIIEHNERVRAQQLVRDLSFGRWVLRIPLEDWSELRRKYPELRAKDHETRSRMWRKLMASSELDAYRVGKT